MRQMLVGCNMLSVFGHLVAKTWDHPVSQLVKLRQSYSNGHLPYHCLFYYLEALDADLACEFARAVRMRRGNLH